MFGSIVKNISLGFLWTVEKALSLEVFNHLFADRVDAFFNGFFIRIHDSVHLRYSMLHPYMLPQTYYSVVCIIDLK